MKPAAASDIFDTVTCIRSSLGASSCLLSNNTKYMTNNEILIEICLGPH